MKYQDDALLAQILGFKKELYYQCAPGDNWEPKDYGFYDLPFYEHETVHHGFDLAGIDKIWFAQTELWFSQDWNWLIPTFNKCREVLQKEMIKHKEVLIADAIALGEAKHPLNILAKDLLFNTGAIHYNMDITVVYDWCVRVARFVYEERNLSIV